MAGRSVAILFLAVIGLLWLLHPSRSLDTDLPANTIEITFMAPAGLTSPGSAFSGMTEAIHGFEELSRQRHAKDPNQPAYRVIIGQYASRDITSDPTRFLLSVAGGVAPDVIYFDRFALPEWSSRGGFAPLDPFIERDRRMGRKDSPYPERFYQAAWEEATFRGKLYGIPNGIDSRALFYNKDLLRRAGLTRPPRTWAELKNDAIKLTEHDGSRLTVVGFAPLLGNSWLYMYSFMAGGSFMSPDGTRCTINSPPVVRALNFMTDVYDSITPRGYAQVVAFQSSAQANDLDPFIQGRIAMKIDVPESMIRIAQFAPDLEFGIAPPPMPEDEIARGRQTVTWSGGFSYAIPYNARFKQAAWEFIRFMTSDEGLRIITESQRESVESQGRLFLPHQVPVVKLNEEFARKYVYDNPAIPNNIKDGYRVFNDLLFHARYRPVTPVGMLLWQEQIRAMDAALYHKLTPKAALDQAAAIVQRDLDQRLRRPTGPVLNLPKFIAAYAILLLVLAGGVYLWDTRRTVRFDRRWIGGWISALPWIVGFVVFSGGPMLFSLLISFCDHDILHSPRFAGLYNYAWMFTQDRLFPLALWNTLYMVIGVPLAIAVSLALALLLNQQIHGIAVWRTFFYLPSIVPMVASSVLWIWILNPQGGLVNSLLRSFGIEGPLWLQDPDWSKPSLILMGLWGAGSTMLIWLAGLKAINPELYEAASLDGASWFAQFRNITIPQLTPYIFFNLVMGLIATFQIFGQAYIMTQGGPVDSTTFYVYHLFNQAFRYGHMGYASALAWFLFALVLVVTIFQIRVSRRWVYYESETP